MSYRTQRLADDISTPPASDERTADRTKFILFFAVLGVGAVLHARWRVREGVKMGKWLSS